MSTATGFTLPEYQDAIPHPLYTPAALTYALFYAAFGPTRHIDVYLSYIAHIGASFTLNATPPFTPTKG